MNIPAHLFQLGIRHGRSKQGPLLAHSSSSSRSFFFSSFLPSRALTVAGLRSPRPATTRELPTHHLPPPCSLPRSPHSRSLLPPPTASLPRRLPRRVTRRPRRDAPPPGVPADERQGREDPAPPHPPLARHRRRQRPRLRLGLGAPPGTAPF